MTGAMKDSMGITITPAEVYDTLTEL